MENTKDSKPIIFSITKVQETKFSIDETLYDVTVNAPFKLDFNFSVGHNLESSQIVFTIVTRYLTQDGSSFVEATVENGFHIQDLEEYLVNNIIEFPIETWAGVIGVSVSHSRALISHLLRLTPYKNCLIPLINPYELAKQFMSAVTPIVQ
jgi:hypothetical protein